MLRAVHFFDRGAGSLDAEDPQARTTPAPAATARAPVPRAAPTPTPAHALAPQAVPAGHGDRAQRGSTEKASFPLHFPAAYQCANKCGAFDSASRAA